MTSTADGEGGDSLPSWIAVGRKLHWWSESQKKNMSVKVTKVDEKKGLVFVTFEVDQKVWKSVPFTKIGKKDCPLRNPEADASGGKSAEASSKDDAGAGKRKRKDERDGSVTPDWWS